MTVHEISSSLRALIAQEQSNIDRLTDSAAQLIASSVADYRLSGDPRIIDDLRGSAQANAELWFTALLEGRPISAESLKPIVGYARRRVHQGISLTGLLRAYRIITRVFWMQLVRAAGNDMSLIGELTIKVSPMLFEHFDIAAEGIATEYQLEQSQHARWRDRLRRDLWDIIRSRPEDIAGFRQHAEALGFDPERPSCTIVMRLSDEANGQPDRHVDPLLLTLARKLGVASDLLMRAIHRDHLVVWVPQPRESVSIKFERSLSDISLALVDTSKVVSSIGIGLPGIGPHGWQASMDQAFRATAEPSAATPGAAVYRYARIFIDDAIRATPNVSDYVRSTISALSVDPALIDTLQTYLAQGLQRKSTANILGVHPNTLDHRLARIESLLDGSFSDVSWIELIDTALRLGRPRRM